MAERDPRNRTGRGPLLRGLAAAVLAAGMLVASAGQGQATGPAAPAPEAQFTPLTAAVLTKPTPFAATDGRTHISYELLTTSALPSSTPLRLDRVDVRDARTHRVIGSLSGQALADAANPVGDPLPGADGYTPAPPGPTPTVVQGSQQWIVWLDLVLDRGRPAPRVLEHRLSGAVLAPSGPSPFEETVQATRISGRPPLNLNPPVRPGTWYSSESCCGNTHHRRGLAPINGRFYVPQRFAIDWYRVGRQGQTWEGDPARLTSYLSYGQPIVASAGGRVVEVQDGVAENTPPLTPPVPPIEDTVGNHVTVQVAPGRYLLYAHMKPGSLRVRKGDRVATGQVLGLIGNSGNSTTPHLHFQVMTTAHFFPTDSPPFTFRRFRVVGHVEPRIWDDNLGLQPTGVLPITPSPYDGPHRDRYPLDREILKF
ncbi:MULTISPECIES: M23 family metallopeptidase [unclassified Streptomyces]|uniref:M23 family metallopeptidase n=1 Tax=unclassified Streptomyces TaxID=2593676 RepID=UPI0029B5E95F|nr:M23 family metallopeptidase [Streptomyces sp. FL07-04A]MDX3575880.1 M23 family metallopeptidase [Streptomyces sp. FL07-04A]